MKSTANIFTTIAVLLIINFSTYFVESVEVVHGKYTEGIKEYHMAIPHKATPDGEFASFHLPHFHDYDATEFRKRRKRDIYDEDSVHYGVPINNELHHLELWPNRDFLHPQAIIERRDPSLPPYKQNIGGFRDKKLCYYIGKVRGLEDSRAALSTCDGLTGYIHFGDEMFFIEPVENHSPNSKGHHLHIVYPANSEPTKGFCGVKNNLEIWEKSIKKFREEYDNGKNVFKKRESDASFDIVPKWMETMVVCDKKMIMKHKGKRDIEQWLLTLFGVVKSYYADSSMTGVLQPILVRIVLLEKEEEEIDLNIIEDCDATLDNFCAWANKLQPKEASHPNHFDVAVLLSELGMEHDGEAPVPCPDQDPADQSWYVMGPYAHLYTFRWSPCSTASMRQLAESHLLDCFDDEPTHEGYALGDGMPGILYSIDEQCNMMLRDVNVSGSCHKQAKVNCSKIWCQDNEGCFMWKLELADGTPCDDNKWCFKRNCEEKGTRPGAIDGGWGDWGDWEKCSKSCGRGIRSRERLCDNPKPENHGKYCTGLAKEYKLCNPEDCPLDAISFREQQCSELFPKSLFITQNGLKPEDMTGALFDPSAPCKLICIIKNESRAVVANVIADGAKCEIGNPLKMCAMGQCREISCDGKFSGSTAVLDRCGICNGDGTMCKLVEGNDTSKRPKGYAMIAVVPAGSKNFKFEEIEPNPNLLALGLPDGNPNSTYFNEAFKKRKTGVYTLGSKKGSFLLYNRKVGEGGGETESIIWDRNKEDIGLYIAHASPKVKKMVKYSWIEPSATPTKEPKYRWDMAEYTQCSARCGGGTQDPILNCFEEEAGKVGNNLCEKLEKPQTSSQKCNENPCAAEWKVSEWGRCRACKKKGGVQVREVQCLKMNPKADGDDILSEDSECPEPKPGTVQLCETDKKCGSKKRKAAYVPAKFQDSVWKQMNKLHLIDKRGVLKSNVYLKGRAPTTTRRTTEFTWKPPPFNKSRGFPLHIDTEHADQQADPVKVVLKKVSKKPTVETENKMGGDPSVVMVKQTVVKNKAYPKRYNNTGKGKKKKKTTRHTTKATRINEEET
ncbi:unnamed protein product [Ceutorhynchus assimilis]|uniref:Uncharacterized protein n=1 Tax=Ceutorhynchus assimilis TaxID=467358 RepID=A0A9N9QIN2_9CUCU|nr:unnamed protein product [Ceutorhynchus assimilis]